MMNILPEPDIVATGSVAASSASRIAIRTGHKILFVYLADVIAVEADGHYVLLQHKSSAYSFRQSISTLAEKLNLCGFVRIHRSYLVNAAFVEEIQLLSKGDWVLRVRGGRKYKVARNYKKNLHLLADSWLGTYGFAAD